MSVSYSQAPLVEIVAELRWGPLGRDVGVKSATSAIPFSLSGQKDEQVYLNFAALVAQLGYARAERLVQPGFPVFPSQVVCRFRPSDVSNLSPLYQIGSGVFSANAVPPNYSSWSDFSPVVRSGIESVVEAFKRSGDDLPVFSEAVVRYIDVFEDRLTDGRSVLEFLTEVLGFTFQLPPALKSLQKDSRAVVPHIQLQIETDIGMLGVAVGHAKKNGADGVLLDSTMTIRREMGSDVDVALQALTDSRGVIHEMFRGLTEKLHERMGPK